MRGEMTVIRPARWMFVVLALGELIATSGAALVGIQRGVTWLTIALAGAALLFSLGMVDLIVSRIELAPDALNITELFRHRSIPKRDIAGVKREGGSVYLQLNDGRWSKVPDTGLSNFAVWNSINAWLK
jgi:hypothetical protein